jgi:hypothetical protein
VTAFDLSAHPKCASATFDDDRVIHFHVNFGLSRFVPLHHSTLYPGLVGI